MNDFENAIPDIDYFVYRNNTPDWRINPSKTDFIDITYILRGNAVYIIGEQKILVGEGDLLCIPAGSYRSAASSAVSLFECFAVNFNMYDTDNRGIPIPLPLLTHIDIDTELISQYKRLNENWLRRGPGWTMRVRAHFMLILQRLLEMVLYDVDTYRFDSRVKAAIRYMTNNYAETISIVDVAKEVHLTPNYLGILFKRETQITFRDYLNMIKLNQAEEMLKTGMGNITEVAQKCGFNDVYYFSRLFKKHKGVPPSHMKG